MDLDPTLSDGLSLSTHHANRVGPHAEHDSNPEPALGIGRRMTYRIARRHPVLDTDDLDSLRFEHLSERTVLDGQGHRPFELKQLPARRAFVGAAHVVGSGRSVPPHVDGTVGAGGGAARSRLACPSGPMLPGAAGTPRGRDGGREGYDLRSSHKTAPEGLRKAYGKHEGRPRSSAEASVDPLMRSGKTVRMQGYHQDPGYASRMYATSSSGLQSGVREYMSGVYAWMAAGFAVTAIVAFFISNSMTAMMTVFGTPLRWVVMLGPLAMSWFLLPRIPSMERPLAVGSFVVFTGMIGAWFSYLPHVYTTGSILGVLGATVGMFAATSIFGWVTKRDLGGIAQFMFMALVGAIFASLINAFLLQSSGMSIVVSVIVAAVSAALTAYHTQAIKQMYLMNGAQGNFAILGALLLYVNFINMFTALLRLFGVARE